LEKTKDEKGQLEQKVLSKLAELEQTIEADNKQFQLIQQRLNEGRNWLYQSIQALTKDKQCLEEQLQILNQKDKELSQWLEEHGGANVAIDNAFVPADPLSEQICQLVAEDAAIEDALYCIDKALTNGKIDLDSYMKVIGYKFEPAKKDNAVSYNFAFLSFLECPNFLPGAVHETGAIATDLRCAKLNARRRPAAASPSCT
jgi:hypothetical protein